MSHPMSEAERIEFMQSIGLNPSTPAAWVPDPTAKLDAVLMAADIVLAPPDVDPHQQHVDDIVFDVRLLDGFPSLEGPGAFKAAADHVFTLYKSYGRDKHRNSTLWRKISMFITTTKSQRATGGLVKEAIKATKPEREIAKVIASQGVTESDIAEALTLLAEKRKKEK